MVNDVNLVGSDSSCRGMVIIEDKVGEFGDEVGELGDKAAKELHKLCSSIS